MTKFIVLNQDDVATLFIDKPVTIHIDEKPYVLCTDICFKNQMTELKPCPFCGSTKINIWNCNDKSDSAWCQCESCLANTSVENTEEEAIEAWNRRVVERDKT